MRVHSTSLRGTAEWGMRDVHGKFSSPQRQNYIFQGLSRQDACSQPDPNGLLFLYSLCWTQPN
jgi:hypothetical protein